MSTNEASATQAVEGLVAVVRSIVAQGHYDNSPEGLMACDVHDWEFYQQQGRSGGVPRPACTCGWDEAKSALDAYEATHIGGGEV